MYEFVKFSLNFGICSSEVKINRKICKKKKFWITATHQPAPYVLFIQCDDLHTQVLTSCLHSVTIIPLYTLAMKYCITKLTNLAVHAVQP